MMNENRNFYKPVLVQSAKCKVQSENPRATVVLGYGVQQNERPTPHFSFFMHEISHLAKKTRRNFTLYTLHFTLLPLLLLSCSKLDVTNPSSTIDAWRTRSAESSSSSTTAASSSSQSSSSTTLVTTSSLLKSAFDDKTSYSEITDSRDGQRYRTVEISTQTWMAQNLNYSGDDGKGNRTYTQGWCYGSTNADTSNHDDAIACETLGRLYAWSDTKILCPVSWHVPSDDDWTTLQTALGDPTQQASLLKSISWSDTTATNASGFSAMPAGQRNFAGFSQRDSSTVFWSSTESIAPYAWVRKLSLDSLEFVRNEGYEKNGYSVRCVKN